MFGNFRLIIAHALAAFAAGRSCLAHFTQLVRPLLKSVLSFFKQRFLFGPCVIHTGVMMMKGWVTLSALLPCCWEPGSARTATIR